MDDTDAFGSTEAFTLVSGGDVEDPYPEFEHRRRTEPVARLQATPVQVGGGDADIFTCYRYHDVDSILRDPQRYSNSTYAAVTGPMFGRTIIEMDPPEHTERRALVNWAFRKRGLTRWRDELIAPKARELVEAFAGDGRAELMRQFCVPYPVQVIAGILGLPQDDYPRFLRWAMHLISFAADYDSARKASAELAEYFAAILAERRAVPAEDLVTHLAQAEVDGRSLDDEEIHSFLRLLITAGAETTARAFGNLMVGLLTHPDHLDAVREDRSRVKAAIEEALRWEPPVNFIQRTPAEDVEIGDVAIRRGSIVSMCLGSANRDEALCPHADDFDIDRGLTQHMSFGAGPHMCLGQQLARAEMEVALETVLDLLPAIASDPERPPPRITGSVFRSPRRLDVVF
ncbi:MAG: cytochrome P450 [Acidimicrobiia bacterium]